MTSTPFSANAPKEKKARLVGHHNNWFVFGLYKNELRRTWSTGLLYAIVLFFAIPIVTLLYLTNRGLTDIPLDPALALTASNRAVEFLSEYITGQNPFTIFFAFVCAFASASVVTDYLFDKRKMNFVCSMPVKRGAYVITKASSSVTWSILSWIPATVLTVIIAAATPLIRPHFALVLSGLGSMFGVWLSYYFYCFGLSLLASCFCGTHAMSSLMMLIIAGYIPIAALTFVGFTELFLDRVWASYYLSSDFFDAISGVYRLAHYCTTKMSAFYYIGTALIGVLFGAVAVFLTVKRKSEMAGVPFAFARVRDTVKYLLIVLAALLCGMLFYVMTEGAFSIIWLIFGIVCGALLAWMLCNTIFYKTPKMMFEGRRGILITVICLIVFSLLFFFDIFGINKYVPSDAMTNSVEMYLGDVELEIKDKKLTRLYNAMVKNGYDVMDSDNFGADHTDPVSSYIGFSDENVVRSFRSVWHTNYLLSVPKYTWAREKDLITFVTELTSHDDFADMYTASVFRQLADAEEKKRSSVRITYDESQYGDTPLTEDYVSTSINLPLSDIRLILETYREELRALGANATQSQYSGDISFSFQNNYVTMPLFVTLDETRALIEKLCEKDAGHLMYSYETERTVMKAELYKNGDVIKTLDEEEVKALFREGVIAFEPHYYNSPLTVFDPDYAIVLECEVCEYEMYSDYYIKYEYSEGDIVFEEATVEIVEDGDIVPPSEGTTFEDTFSCRFFLGKVPQDYLD